MSRLGAVPGAARHGALQAPVVQAVEIGEDAILVGEHDLDYTFDTGFGALSSAIGARPAASARVDLARRSVGFGRLRSRRGR